MTRCLSRKFAHFEAVLKISQILFLSISSKYLTVTILVLCSSSEQQCIKNFKCYLLAGFAFFGDFFAQEVIRRAAVRELVFRIFITIKSFDSIAIL